MGSIVVKVIYLSLVVDKTRLVLNSND